MQELKFGAKPTKLSTQERRDIKAIEDHITFIRKYMKLTYAKGTYEKVQADNKNLLQR